jgi:hypothetical protein
MRSRRARALQGGEARRRAECQDDQQPARRPKEGLATAVELDLLATMPRVKRLKTGPTAFDWLSAEEKSARKRRSLAQGAARVARAGARSSAGKAMKCAGRIARGAFAAKPAEELVHHRNGERGSNPVRPHHSGRRRALEITSKSQRPFVLAISALAGDSVRIHNAATLKGVALAPAHIVGPERRPSGYSGRCCHLGPRCATASVHWRPSTWE